MTRDEFISSGYFLFGKHWRQRMAEVLHVQPSSVSRWASGATEVLPVASVAVRLLVERKRADGCGLPGATASAELSERR